MSVNVSRTAAGWGASPPRYVQLLIDACNASSQRFVAGKLGRSSGYVNRLLYRTYAGSYEEAEQLVLSVLGGDTVVCPIWNAPIPLRVCMRERRRKALPINSAQQMYARACPDCPNNLERFDD